MEMHQDRLHFAVKSCKLKYKNIDYFLLKILNGSGNINKPGEK